MQFLIEMQKQVLTKCIFMKGCNVICYNKMLYKSVLLLCTFDFVFMFNRLPVAIFFAKPYFTMFPNGNSRRITVNRASIIIKIIN